MSLHMKKIILVLIVACLEIANQSFAGICCSKNRPAAATQMLLSAHSECSICKNYSIGDRVLSFEKQPFVCADCFTLLRKALSSCQFCVVLSPDDELFFSNFISQVQSRLETFREVSYQCQHNGTTPLTDIIKCLLLEQRTILEISYKEGPHLSRELAYLEQKLKVFDQEEHHENFLKFKDKAIELILTSSENPAARIFLKKQIIKKIQKILQVSDTALDPYTKPHPYENCPLIKLPKVQMLIDQNNTSCPICLTDEFPLYYAEECGEGEKHPVCCTDCLGKLKTNRCPTCRRHIDLEGCSPARTPRSIPEKMAQLRRGLSSHSAPF